MTARSEVETAESADPHRNEVVLVGVLAGESVVREMPSGDEVVGFRLTVRSGAPPGARGSTRKSARSDSVECAVWTAGLRKKLTRCRTGDLLEVSGALRHRYWRGTGGLASRYEVEVLSLRVIAKAASIAATNAGAAQAS